MKFKPYIENIGKFPSEVIYVEHSIGISFSKVPFGYEVTFILGRYSFRAGIDCS